MCCSASMISRTTRCILRASTSTDLDIWLECRMWLAWSLTSLQGCLQLSGMTGSWKQPPGNTLTATVRRPMANIRLTFKHCPPHGYDFAFKIIVQLLPPSHMSSVSEARASDPLAAGLPECFDCCQYDSLQQSKVLACGCIRLLLTAGRPWKELTSGRWLRCQIQMMGDSSPAARKPDRSSLFLQYSADWPGSHRVDAVEDCMIAESHYNCAIPVKRLGSGRSVPECTWNATGDSLFSLGQWH